MALYIKVIKGAQKGQLYALEAGKKVGRNMGEIIIKDEKISSLHAQIELNDSGQFVLVDRGSLNGIKINGEKRDQIILVRGVIFCIGKTFFQVVDETSEKKKENWNSVLNDVLPKLTSREAFEQDHIQIISPPLKLTFTQGIQSDTSYLITYGPRKVGSDSLDIELLDSQAPREAFEINPKKTGVVIDAKDSSVLFNGKFVSSSFVKTGDFIQIGDTLIELSFGESSL